MKWLDLGKAGQGDEYNQSPVYENSKNDKNEKKQLNQMQLLTTIFNKALCHTSSFT